MNALHSLIAAVKSEELSRDAEKCYACFFIPFQSIRSVYFNRLGPVSQKLVYGSLLATQVTLSATSTYISSTHTTLWLRIVYTLVTIVPPGNGHSVDCQD
jgi:hypothetical protein